MIIIDKFVVVTYVFLLRLNNYQRRIKNSNISRPEKNPLTKNAQKNFPPAAGNEYFFFRLRRARNEIFFP